MQSTKKCVTISNITILFGRIKMNRFPIGVIIDSFRTDTYTTIRKAVEMETDIVTTYIGVVYK